ncbi:MAG: AAA family ATPase [Rhabdochlamydiaceae bacterium]
MPCNFSHLIGNPQAKAILSRLVLNQAVPQVLLFHGPRGIGKGLFALKLAETLLKSTKTQHPDLHTLYPDPDSDQHPIATLRQLIQETALPPFEAPCKVFILHDIEKMLPTSSNTLLKILEEPPSDTQFILLTSQPSILLSTILSRCSKIPFYPIPDEELTLFLLEKHHAPDAKKIALLSEGSVAEALHRLTTQKSILPLDELFRCHTYTELHQILHPLSDTFSSLDTDRLFEEMLYWIRESDPLRLGEAVPLIADARVALFHHLKLKTVLERFFICYQLKNLFPL